MGHFLSYAKMLTWQSTGESLWERRALNWSSTWSAVMILKENETPLQFDCGSRMPFPSKQNVFKQPTFPPFDSKLKRLVDSLPDELFEARGKRGEMKIEIIRRISGHDLDNFMIFRNSDIIEPAKKAEESLDFPVSHSPSSTEAVLGRNSSERRELNEDLSDEEGNMGARNGNGNEAQRSIDLESTRTTEIADEMGRDLEHQEAQSDEHTHRSSVEYRDIATFSFERIVNEKFPDQDNIIRSFLLLDQRLNPVYESYLKLHYGFDTHLIRPDNSLPSHTSVYPLPEKRVLEFTIHLENIFATYSGSKHAIYPETPGNLDHNRYFAELCRNGKSPRMVLAEEKVKPLCTFESHYWLLWNLPSCTPPALGDVDVRERLKKLNRPEIGGLKFIGYVMETVRNGLAKWTVENVGESLDSEVWSPRAETSSASVEFGASDEFRNQIMLRKRRNVRKNVNVLPSEFLSVRLLWECQKYLIQKMKSNVYGPSDVELMLLSILGFPALEFGKIDPEVLRYSAEANNTCPTEQINSTGPEEMSCFYTFTPRLSRKHLLAAISFRDCEESLNIQMQLLPVVSVGVQSAVEEVIVWGESYSFTFCWAELIHSFEACMKVLSYDYRDGDICEVYADEESLAQSEPESRVVSEAPRGSGYDNRQHQSQVAEDLPSNAETDTSGREEEGTEAILESETEDGMEITDFLSQEYVTAASDWVTSENGIGGVEEHLVECRCRSNRYMLNQKAKRVFIRGTQKYFWEWEGWKAQAAFERYPILYDDSRNADSNSGAGDVELHTMHNNGETRIPMSLGDDGDAANASGLSGSPESPE
ncbi:hypothetical protein FGB62_60g17 [Gracilaria domingensis]|nr:hypothetical protein FGB62_60g17 [Gracilaria domingensis]